MSDGDCNLCHSQPYHGGFVAGIRGECWEVFTPSTIKGRILIQRETFGVGESR